MLARIIKKCLSCGFVRPASFRGEGCDGCGIAKDLDWWVSTGASDSEGYKLIPRLEELLANHQYEDIVATLSPVEHVLAGSDKPLSILASARELYASTLHTEAQKCLRSGDVDEAIRLCSTIESECGKGLSQFTGLRHDISSALTQLAATAMQGGDLKKTIAYAEQALQVVPGNPAAQQLRNEAQARIRLTDLARKALQAYKSRNLSQCQSACQAFVEHQRACGAQVEFTDGAGSVIDFAALPEKLQQEIAAQEDAVRRQQAEQARRRRAARTRQLVRVAAACIVMAVAIGAFAHWRQSVYRNRVAAFESAMQAETFDVAKSLARPIAKRHPPAAELLRYFAARSAFEFAIDGANERLMQQYAATKWTELKAEQKAAETAARQPGQGLESYKKAEALLAECKALVDAGEQARREREDRERALAQAEAKRQREEAERKRQREAEERVAVEKARQDALARTELLSSVRFYERRYGLSYLPPKGWIRKDGDGSFVCTWRDDKQPKKPVSPYLEMRFNRNDAGSLEDAAEGGLRGIQEGFSELGFTGRTLGTQTFRTKEGKRGVRLVAGAETPDGAFRITVYLIEREDVVMQLLWITSSSQLDELEGMMDSCAESVQFTDSVEGSGDVQNDEAGALASQEKDPLGDDPVEQNNMGFRYLTGDGVRKDPYEAAKWLLRAAQNGNPNAQCTLGVMYHEGVGVPQDDRQAAMWYRKSAEQGFAAAQSNLGILYKNGWGVSRNVNEAVKWFRLAARQGEEIAIKNLQALGIQPSGYLYRCPSCGRKERVTSRPAPAVTFSCRMCMGTDMQYVGPAY